MELDRSGSAFGKQFKRADRCGAPWALVIGDHEAEQGCVRLKALQGEAVEQAFGLDAIPALLEALA